MRESTFQAHLIKQLKIMFEGCVILKNDSDYIQGIPDLTILYKNRWAMLEVKAGPSAPFQPNQEYYLDKLNKMCFAAAIWPDNEEEVINDLQRVFL